MQNTNQIIDAILSEKKDSLGSHFDKYRNHVYRTFNLCIEMDKDVENVRKYAIASAFHDIGIWTNDTFDYLEPSINLAKKYLEKINKNEWVEEVSLMIDMHHKISKYTGPYEITVEVFRKADWIDVSRGIISFDLSKSAIKRINRYYPNLGFHKFLISKGLNHLLKSPLDPLPMFKY